MNIIGSLEEWDSIINYYRPNASSKTWYLNELKHLSIPLMWGEWNVFTEQKELFNAGNFKDAVTPNIYNGIVQFLPIDKIEGNHLYIISIYTSDFFRKNEVIGLSCMSEKYKTDVREGRCKIFMTLLYEGHSGSKGNRDLEIIESWRIKENFPKDSIYFLTGNLIADKLCKEKKLDIKVHGIQMFEVWNWNTNFSKLLPPVRFSPVDEKYLYLSYNRQPRAHRLFFVHELIKNNLLNDGLISLNKPDMLTTRIPFVEEKIMNFIITNTPFNIDPKFDLNFNLACNLVRNDYERTFISVISETLVDEDCLFLSEKIWKPIILGHPFMVHGNQNTLKHLKQLGYKTFDKWIDESYDSEQNHMKRAQMIINELSKFKNHSIDELKEMRQEMFSICEYNQKLFVKLASINYKNGQNLQLIKYIESIWNELNGVATVKKRLI